MKGLRTDIKTECKPLEYPVLYDKADERIPVFHTLYPGVHRRIVTIRKELYQEMMSRHAQ